MESTDKQQFEAIAPDAMAGSRVDQVMSKLFSDFSRSRITEWIRNGEATVDGRVCRPRDKILGGEKLLLTVQLQTQTEDLPQAIDLEVVYDDKHLLVINKPAGLVVHPAAGNRDGTVLNALLYHFPGQKNLPRAGIVHRLDKDTTGLMVVAKSEKAHNKRNRDKHAPNGQQACQLQRPAFTRRFWWGLSHINQFRQ